MGALPSCEANEDPSSIAFARCGAYMVAHIPLTPHFFPSARSRAFRQLCHARKSQSPVYCFNVLNLERYLPREAAETFRAAQREDWGDEVRERDPSVCYVDEEDRTHGAADEAVYDAASLYQVLVQQPTATQLMQTNAEMCDMYTQEEQWRARVWRACRQAAASRLPHDATEDRQHHDPAKDVGHTDSEHNDNTRRVTGTDEIKDTASCNSQGRSSSHKKNERHSGSTSHQGGAYTSNDKEEEVHRIMQAIGDPPAVFLHPLPVAMAVRMSAEEEAAARARHARKHSRRGAHGSRRLAVVGHDSSRLRTRPSRTRSDEDEREALLVSSDREEEEEQEGDEVGSCAQRNRRGERIRINNNKSSSSSSVISTPCRTPSRPPSPREACNNDNGNKDNNNDDNNEDDEVAVSAAIAPSSYRIATDATLCDGKVHLVAECGVLYLLAYDARVRQPCEASHTACFTLPMTPVRVVGMQGFLPACTRGPAWLRCDRASALQAESEEDTLVEAEAPSAMRVTDCPLSLLDAVMERAPRVAPVLRFCRFIAGAVGHTVLNRCALVLLLRYEAHCRSAGLPETLVRPFWVTDTLSNIPTLQLIRECFLRVKAAMAEVEQGERALRRRLAHTDRENDFARCLHVWPPARSCREDRMPVGGMGELTKAQPVDERSDTKDDCDTNRVQRASCNSSRRQSQSASRRSSSSSSSNGNTANSIYKMSHHSRVHHEYTELQTVKAQSTPPSTRCASRSNSNSSSRKHYHNDTAAVEETEATRMGDSSSHNRVFGIHSSRLEPLSLGALRREVELGPVRSDHTVFDILPQHVANRIAASTNSTRPPTRGVRLHDTEINKADFEFRRVADQSVIADGSTQAASQPTQTQQQIRQAKQDRIDRDDTATTTTTTITPARRESRNRRAMQQSLREHGMVISTRGRHVLFRVQQDSLRALCYYCSRAAAPVNIGAYSIPVDTTSLSYGGSVKLDAVVPHTMMQAQVVCETQQSNVNTTSVHDDVRRVAVVHMRRPTDLGLMEEYMRRGLVTVFSVSDVAMRGRRPSAQHGLGKLILPTTKNTTTIVRTNENDEDGKNETRTLHTSPCVVTTDSPVELCCGDSAQSTRTPVKDSQQDHAQLLLGPSGAPLLSQPQALRMRTLSSSPEERAPQLSARAPYHDGADKTEIYPADAFCDGDLVVYNTRTERWEFYEHTQMRRRRRRCVGDGDALHRSPSSHTEEERKDVLPQTPVHHPQDDNDAEDGVAQMDNALWTRFLFVGLSELILSWTKWIVDNRFYEDPRDMGWLRDIAGAAKPIRRGRYFIWSFRHCEQRYFYGVLPKFVRTKQRRRQQRRPKKSGMGATAAAAVNIASARSRSPADAPDGGADVWNCVAAATMRAGHEMCEDNAQEDRTMCSKTSAAAATTMMQSIRTHNSTRLVRPTILTRPVAAVSALMQHKLDSVAGAAAAASTRSPPPPRPLSPCPSVCSLSSSSASSCVTLAEFNSYYRNNGNTFIQDGKRHENCYYPPLSHTLARAGGVALPRRYTHVHAAHSSVLSSLLQGHDRHRGEPYHYSIHAWTPTTATHPQPPPSHSNHHQHDQYAPLSVVSAVSPPTGQSIDRCASTTVGRSSGSYTGVRVYHGGTLQARLVSSTVRLCDVYGRAVFEEEERDVGKAGGVRGSDAGIASKRAGAPERLHGKTVSGVKGQSRQFRWNPYAQCDGLVQTGGACCEKSSAKE